MGKFLSQPVANGLNCGKKLSTSDPSNPTRKKYCQRQRRSNQHSLRDIVCFWGLPILLSLPVCSNTITELTSVEDRSYILCKCISKEVSNCNCKILCEQATLEREEGQRGLHHGTFRKFQTPCRKTFNKSHHWYLLTPQKHSRTSDLLPYWLPLPIENKKISWKNLLRASTYSDQCEDIWHDSTHLDWNSSYDWKS